MRPAVTSPSTVTVPTFAAGNVAAASRPSGAAPPSQLPPVVHLPSPDAPVQVVPGTVAALPTVTFTMRQPE